MTEATFPTGACDCHVHVFSYASPVVPTAVVRPPPATVADYQRFAQRAGTQRLVLVQPSTYGTDNSLMLQALAELGPRARAVAVVNDTVTDEQLQTLHAAGVRGLRFNQVQVGATQMGMMKALAHRIAAWGWHIQLHMHAADLVEHEELLATLPTPLVLDHGGRVDLDGDQHAAGRDAVHRLVGRGHVWVKLSAPYLQTAHDAPSCPRAAQWGRDLVGAAPERMLWASDWPHATEHAKPALDGLVDYLWKCASDAQTARRILVDNPSTLYWQS